MPVRLVTMGHVLCETIVFADGRREGPVLGGRWVPICPPRHPSNYERMTAHFLDCIINDKPPLVSGEDGARAIEVMCGAIKSMETGAWVDLPLKEEVVPPGYDPPQDGA